MTAYVTKTSEIHRDENRVDSRGSISPDSEVLAHHFPQFPILPGVLMLDIMRATAETWYGKKLKVQAVKRARFSNYLKPGSVWQARLKLEDSSPAGDRWQGSIFLNDAKIASAILTLSVKG